ncbi:MAG TPA: hypothetical protein VF143_04420 [Candidatus Nanopelagicales bacterium]
MAIRQLTPVLPTTRPAPTVPDASVIDGQALRGVVVGLGLSAVLWLIIALVVIAVW